MAVDPAEIQNWLDRNFSIQQEALRGCAEFLASFDLITRRKHHEILREIDKRMGEIRKRQGE